MSLGSPAGRRASFALAIGLNYVDAPPTLNASIDEVIEPTGWQLPIAFGRWNPGRPSAAARLQPCPVVDGEWKTHHQRVAFAAPITNGNCALSPHLLEPVLAVNGGREWRHSRPPDIERRMPEIAWRAAAASSKFLWTIAPPPMSHRAWGYDSDMRINPRTLPNLEDIFELDDQFLLSPHAGAWRPALICGRRLSDGSTVVLKYWKKARTSIDADLRDLWRREVRHAERLRARPGADGLLVPMLEASEADDAFYVVMPGEWVPLKVKLRDCGSQHWCRGLQVERHRQILWRNLRRLVQGLDVIHAQRVVHGGLDEDVVFTASDHEADFRIGGFEWCFHVSEGASGPSRPFASSLTDDFASVGGLLARMLGLGMCRRHLF